MEEDHWDLPLAASYILQNGHKSAALQFPDDLLCYSSRVSSLLQKRDTAYNPLAVDEVAAMHVGASCVVHFGRASLTPITSCPAFFVFPKYHISIGHAALASTQLAHAAAALACRGSSSNPRSVVVIIDQVYHHARSLIQVAVQKAFHEVIESSVSLLFAEPLPRSLEPVSSTRQRGQEQCSPSSVRHQETSTSCGTSCGTSDDAAALCSASCTPSACGKVNVPDESAADTALVPGSCQILPENTGMGRANLSDESQGAAESLTCESSRDRKGVEGAEQTVLELRGFAGECWYAPQGLKDEECLMVWFGSQDAEVLQFLQLTYSTSQWLCCDPGIELEASGSISINCTASKHEAPKHETSLKDVESGNDEPARSCAESATYGVAEVQISEGLSSKTQALLKRRYYLVEKAKQASTVGILVGTLACAGFESAINMVRRQAKLAGKKTYTFVMGKPNPAKLGNFQEVDVYVMVADPLGFLLESKEYLAPILTPHEAMLAFSDRSLDLTARYPLDFLEVIQSSSRYAMSDSEEDANSQDTALVEKSLGGLQVGAQTQHSLSLVAAHNAAEYHIIKRGYKGLETPLTGADKLSPVELVQGKFGRAAGYVDAVQAKKTDSEVFTNVV
ncbi:hypothetical protein CEUSTIGMA_g10896.t1 [Chlamydomonas eustigma]|uniref:Diphthamide biosynthesis protein 2 n=1 Tax=Chlamydomonas eustigma TaxID=1157962 RepID=A0A250XK57_9CHLO|nr:hypothetical protein CEUSTIGMA_g10896.t1 [Chlamydomonas eustigma]|eukprot:GAX83471.1 hypothetical protein CEUSTIGMA_g10896.t1 [Chlamydomonas eustigma]